MSDDDIPEADRIGDAPHPRETPHLFGHTAVERDVAQAFGSGAFPHAWLLTGPRGVGKATLAWRMARFLLNQPPPGDAGLFGAPPPATTLDTDPESPISRRMRALSEPALLLVRRAWDPDRKRIKAQITVDEVRKINGFFALSATDGGHRVVIVDSADEMNVAAANALLKVLEEPPKNAVLILVSHQPARLLPTIRSRCRAVRLAPLGEEDLARAVAQTGIDIDNIGQLTALSGGSVGEAVRLATQDGLALFDRIDALIRTCPSLDREAALALAEYATQRGAEDRLDLTFHLMDLAVTHRARANAATDAVAARAWATLQQDLSQRVGHGRGVNIDAQSLILDCFLRINQTAADSAPARP